MLEVSSWERDCRMCKQDIPDDPIYYCPIGCLFTIHKSCSSTIQQSLHHLPFHPHRSLFLSDHIHPHSLCNACGSHSVNMSAYTCFDCSFTLHVVCASLTPTTKTIQSQIQLQPTHPHPLISCDLNNNKCDYTYTCSCCSQPFDDERSVVYLCLECKGLLHKTCAQLPRKIDHSFHPSHPLILLPQKPRFFGYTCGACSQYKDSFIYHCSDCEFYLDIACASLSPNPAENSEFGQIGRFSHSNPLILCDNKQKFEICCYACEIPLGDSICFCAQCKVLLHESCADLPHEMKHMFHPVHTLTLRYHRHCISKLPPTLKYFNHVHTLTLNRSSIQDYPDEDDDAEFYCDACEERRVLAHPTYYCKDCHYVAYCHCTVSARKSGQSKRAIEVQSKLRVVRSHFGLQADVSTYLTLAKLDEEIGEQCALLDSKEIIASEQDREIDKLRERIASMQLTRTKVHKEIAELHKKIKALEEKRAISRFTEECLSDALELEGQTAGVYH
ncbi:hypothetical protein ACSBR1_015689 [Camellia fascicularis]